MNSALVSFENVVYTYPNGVTALRGVDLNLDRGAAVAIIGENGSGKTTLAKHVNGLLKPTSGRVTVKGTDTREKETYALARDVGYVFQNPAHQLFTGSVRLELEAGPRNLGLAESEVVERTKEAAEVFDLDSVLDTNPQDAPFPRKKIIAIASIFTMKPEIMLLDEPTTGQDHIGIDRVKSVMTKLQNAGLTLVVISHDMRFVAEVAERVVVMVQGKIIADGPTREIFVETKLLSEARVKPPQVIELDLALRNSIHIDGEVPVNSKEEVDKLRRFSKQWSS